MAALACGTAVLALLVLDFAWLGVAGAGQRFMDMGARLGGERWSSGQMALLVLSAYALLGLALCRFVVLPAAGTERPALRGLVQGALLGLVIYGVYDLTNLVVFGKAYGLGLAASDAAWGVFAFGCAGLLGGLALR